MDLVQRLKETISGDVLQDKDTLEKYSHDTSLFKVSPKVVVCPKDSKDIEKLVKFVSSNKKDNPDLSLTARSAGTDMTGGPLNESIIVSFTEHLNKIKSIDSDNLEAVAEPGVFYRDFEKESLAKNVLLPSYPASKSIAALGGMIANNAGGEKTLRYGKTNKYIKELKVVLSDGNEYSFKSLAIQELEEKKSQNNFEGEVYRKTYDLLEKNYALVRQAEPKVSKNSAGYALWRVWDKKNFDLTQLFCGAQGTLGLITEAKIKLVREKSKKRMVALFFKSWDDLPQVVNAILPYEPDSLETFDSETLKLGLRFMPEVAKKAGQSFLSFALRFLPEFWIGILMLGLPKLIVLVEITDDDENNIQKRINLIKEALHKFGTYYRVVKDEKDADKYWTMRRESFNLLRQHVKNKKTAPFIDDFCVKPELVPEFLPKILKILRRNNIKVNIAGHAGDGNFHIIPLMDLKDEKERKKIINVANEVYDLVIQYKGSITAEHNDGIIRTPYLEKMYGDEIYELFKEVKNIFDPQNIFNPGKKVGGSLEYAESHINA